MSRNSLVVRSPFVAALLTLAAAGAPAPAQLPIGEPVLVNSASQAGDQQLPEVGLADDGRIRVVWSDRTTSDVRLRNFAADGTPFNETDLFQVDASEANAVISVNGSGDWLAAWDTNQAAGDGRDLFGRRTSTNGSVLLSEFQVNADDEVDITLPARLSRGDDDSFVAVWRDDSSPGELYFRKFAANGTAVTGDLTANEANDPDLADFDVAAAPDGGFMIVWQGNASPGQNVLGRCFDAAGLPVGAQFAVPAEAAPSNFTPFVGVDGTGAFVVVWTEGGTADLEWRRIGPDCLPVGGDRLAIADGPDGSSSVELDVAPDGAFVLTWTSNDIDTDDGVSVLELTKSGTTVGGEFLAHDIEAGRQSSPGVGVGSSLFAIVWQDQEGTTGADDDIHLQRFRRRVVFTDDFESTDLAYWNSSAP